MIKYNKYKPSDIDWLGDIPIDWEVKRVKDILIKIGSGVTPKGGSEVYVKSGIPLIRSQNVYDDGLRIDNVSFISEVINDKMKNSQIQPNDILINITGASIGRSCVVPNSLAKANINQHIIYLRINSKLVPFMTYFIKSNSFKEYINLIQAGTSKESLNMGQTMSIPILLPNADLQKSIVHFITTKTQSIDKKINLLTQKANYYKEYRKSLINHTVCNGLNKNINAQETELGFTVNPNFNRFRLKDLGYLYSGLSGKSGEDFNQNENPNNKGFIPFTNIANNTYLKKDHLGTVVVYANENQNSVKKEDIFFLMSSEGYEDIGKSAILNDDLNETYLNSFCKGFRVTNRKANPYFLNYLLLSDNYRKLLIVEGKGFTRINLKMEKVNDFIVFIPNTIDEQNKIVSFLDNKTQTIDKIVSNINTQIATLKELRKTLINDAVTGKIKVVS